VQSRTTYLASSVPLEKMNAIYPIFQEYFDLPKYVFVKYSVKYDKIIF